MQLEFGGQQLVLDCSGIVLWPAHDIAIVSDLHLEKGSHFAMRGFFLPPYDSQATLQKLLKVCQDKHVKQLILLGDCFHDPKGFTRLTDEARDLFAQLLDYQPIWIKGNHDKDFVPDGFAAYKAYERDGLMFRHQAEPGAVNEISGHFHPKAKMIYKGAKIQRACFVEDSKKLLLPAFGAYTGGLFLDSPAIRDVFPDPFRFHVLGAYRVFSFDYDGSLANS